MADIYKYVVVKEIDHDPMYGRIRKLTGYLDDKQEAIRIAKSKNDEYVYALEKQYTCQANVDRDFPLYTNIVWNVWTGEQ